MTRGERRFPASLRAPVAGPVAASRSVLRPQRPLHEAEIDRHRAIRPAGLGLDSDAVRRTMVARLKQGGLRDPRVVDAMGQVPRHQFVDSALVHQAYEDTSLPIGLGQTISKPSVVARMLELLLDSDAVRGRGGRLGRVLEIGTGCGYQAAVLAQLAGQVVSIERLHPLHVQASARLKALQIDHVRLLWADGRAGHPPSAPYDAIISAAGGDDVPRAWLDQLAVGGRLVAPTASGPRGAQTLAVVDRDAQGWRRHEAEGVQFVPLEWGKA